MNVQKSIVLLLLLITGSATGMAQQGFGTNAPAASAVVDMTATNKGMLLPRIALTATTVAAPVSAPANNLLVFNTATAGDVTPGLYFWNGTSWIRLLAKGDDPGASWNLTGNAGTTPGTIYVGTTDAQDMVIETNNTERMRITQTGSVGIGTSTPNSAAILDVSSTTQGFLMPRMTAAQIAAIPNPVEGSMVYNTDVQCLMYYAKGTFNCAFTAPPSPPVASNVTVNGNVITGSTLTATYTYIQYTGITEGSSRYQWYSATASDGTGQAALSGATASTYTVAAPVGTGKFVGVGVTPVTSAGIAGAQALSPWRAFINNTAPSFGSVTNSAAVTGIGSIATLVTASYTDVDGDAAGTPTYQWYRYTDTAGNGKAAIAGATAATYTFTLSDVGYYIKAGATATATTGTTPGTEQLASTYLGPVVACGGTYTVVHTAGTVAPVNKTVTYGTVLTSIGGTGAKCWITQNLGATNQATVANDATEPSAGWYWQFNRAKGYYNPGPNGTATTPWTITSINESSDWLLANDPCKLLLGAGWRIPTYTEWYNADTNSAWGSYYDTYNSILKIHAAGGLQTNGKAIYIGAAIGIWSSTQISNTNGYYLTANSATCSVTNNSKALGSSVRCLKD